ncbi:MORN repeat-containing protein 2-like isoform X2 [Symsagittifera roscoffensis]|uniref:MORN repeat-containing protein 2-like isoform X1 n=1 Tax=Symsagittifera roscoffensis TaxID=84072 RepID=UPI00307B67EE
MPPKKTKKQVEDEEPRMMNGVFMFPNGDRYDGDYMRKPDGTIFRQGQGCHTASDGTKYEGEWLNDTMTGQGSVEYPSGASYEGEFNENKFHGSGRYNWPDGAVYSGHFEDNRICGDGEFLDPDGQAWVGNFDNKMALGLKFKLGL